MTGLTLQQRTVGLCAGLAVLVGITFLYATKQWYSDWVLAHQQPPAAVGLATDETATLIAGLPDSHLFGQDLTDTGNMPISSLQLKVTGIVKVENEQGRNVSKVYISSGGGATKIYQVGDIMPSGVKVYDISADAVILENDGKLEKLPLPREPLEFKPKSTTEDNDGATRE